MNPARFQKPTVWICLALAAITLAIYWPVTGHDFVDYDDNFFITKNPHVQKGFTRDNLSYAFTTRDAYLWHPLTWYSHMMDCQLFGLKPGRHHLTGLLFHTANTVLLFFVLLRLAKNLWPAAVVAALFAWHPFHVESVAWVAERKDVLSCFFFLLTLWAYLRYTEKPSFARYAVMAVMFALGLMAKPMIVTLPFVLLLLDFWPLGRIKFGNTSTVPPGKPSASPPFWPQARKLVLEKIPLFAMAAAVSAISFHVTKTGGAVMSTEHLPLGARLVNAVVSYATYVVKTFWPANLAVYYPHETAKPWWLILGAAALLAAVTWLALAGWRRRPWLLVGWLWFLGTLVPVIQIVQSGSHAMADRYTYIPLMGVFIMLAWGLVELAARWQKAVPALVVTAGLALLACLALTREQLAHWRDTFSLFDHAIKVTQGNYMAHKSVGDVLIEQGEKGDKGKFNEGINHYLEALKFAPKFAEVHNNLGVAYFKAGQFTNALEPFRRAVEYKPAYAAAHKNLGNALVMAGRPAEAIPSYQEALRLKPDFTEARNYLGLAFFKLKRYDEAIPNYLEALRQQPDLTGARYDLGLIYFDQSKFAEAAEQFTAILKVNPADANAHYRLGLVRVTQHKAAEALPHLREAVRLRPDSLPPRNALAWILATHEDEKLRAGAEALRLAERTVQISSPNSPLLNTLAAAQAEAGQFPQAAATAQKALELAQVAGQKEMAAQLQERLALYQKSKPFRDAGLSPPKPKVTITPLPAKAN